MKKYRLLCLLLCVLWLMGCAASGEGTGSTAGTESTQTGATVTPPESGSASEPEEAATLPKLEQPDGAVIAANPGKLRISYIGDRSSVWYISSVRELPQELADKGYDDAFFAEHALVAIIETTNSGSIQVGVKSIIKEDGVVTVMLSREALDNADVTMDMATWLLWAEVPAGLDACTWVVGNASRPGITIDK